jgi:hypothetical protein
MDGPPTMPAAQPRLYCFAGGPSGAWQVLRSEAVAGPGLAPAPCLSVWDADGRDGMPDAAWRLRGITSNERYVTRGEKTQLLGRQQGLGRPAASRAALIPIRKSAAWWALTQDERREVFEAQPAHIAIGLRYLPAIARRLHHCRDLGTDEPFDFLTWFDFAPQDEAAFDRLLQALRSSPEWRYVEREVDIRLQRCTE